MGSMAKDREMRTHAYARGVALFTFFGNAICQVWWKIAKNLWSYSRKKSGLLFSQHSVLSHQIWMLYIEWYKPTEAIQKNLTNKSPSPGLGT